VSSFGEIMSPRFVQRVDLLTGFMPAQFGYRNEGIIDIHTVEGCSNPGGSVGFSGGQRGTLQPSFEYAGCNGNLSYYVGGFYLQNDLGLQPPTPAHTPTHDHTNQGQFFGYFSYLLGPDARLSLITGTSINAFQIPPNPNVTPAFALSGVPHFPSLDVAESKLEQSYFAILALNGTVGADFDYQAAFFTRYYQLSFDPDPVGDLIYNGIAARLLETGFLNGIQTDIAYRYGLSHTFRAGLYASGEAIESDDHARVFPANPDGSQSSTVPEPVIDNHNSKAILFDAYLQDEWHPNPKFTLIAGIRFDLMDAYLTQWQFSPRVGATYALTPDTSLHAGYARYFQTPPFEAVLFGTVGKFAGTTGEPGVASGDPNVKAERDHYFDAGITQKLTRQLNVSIDGFFLLADDKLDLAQFGSTYVFAPISYRDGRSWGADISLTESLDQLSCYFNFSYAIVQERDIVAGQFLAEDPEQVSYVSRHWIISEDNQMFTASAGASYRWRGFLLTADSIWGSGYRRGFANTGELPPILQFDAAVARNFALPRVGNVIGRIAVVNLFDHPYEIRNGTGIGIFSPQWGPRRALTAGVKIPLPLGLRAPTP
jgi:outer membrane receptor protein involved in Fe transport